jgi:hypothetical protein
MKKTLTKADVFDVASDLIEANGSTTTLDIKKELRNRGFFALQADVSDYMVQVCSEEDWDFTFNGAHRVYTESSNSGNTQTTQNQNTGNSASTGLRAAMNGNQNTQNTPSHNATGKSHTTRSGKVITAFDDESKASSGDWKAYSVVSQDEYFFPATYTRDDVRLAYRAFLGIYNIADVRACRI